MEPRTWRTTGYVLLIVTAALVVVPLVQMATTDRRSLAWLFPLAVVAALLGLGAMRKGGVTGA